MSPPNTVLTKDNRSREHVFADWLLRYYKIGDYVTSPRIEEAGSVSIRRHPLGAFQLGGVCRHHCNAGWMSRLENQVKPLLIALAREQRGVGDFSHKEQSVLARWAAKTSFILHAAGGFARSSIPVDLYPDLMNQTKSLPAGVSVFAFQTPDLAEDILPVTAIQSSDWIGLVPGEPLERLPFDAIKISIRIGMLQLLVAYVADPSWSIVTWKDVHLPLWPTRLGLTYEAGLRHNLVRPRKESGTVLFHVSLVISRGLSQQDLDFGPRPAIENALEKGFRRFGGEIAPA